MYKIAVVGDSDSVSGFASAGLEVYPVDDFEKGAAVLRKIGEGDYAVVFITESLAEGLGNEIKKLDSHTLPAVTLIPGVTGNTGEGMRSISRYVERAVGSDILKN